MAIYDFKDIEKKYIDRYSGFDGFKGKDFETSKSKFYMLTEFPYPSGSGLHVGHAFTMTGADVYARFMRMKGKNVMFPMGWDAFGLPTENYAIKTGIKPQVTTSEVTRKFKEQMNRLGFSFDWDREVNTTLPEYYKWTQWIFIKLFEKGLAHKEEMPINWCPKDKIGLANEEVIDGKCERCGTETERKVLSQWVVKITDYADRLIEGLKNTEFIEKVKAAQINWIGKKEGAKIRFEITDANYEPRCLEIFTSRPDTIAGATFMVVAPEHYLVSQALLNKNDRVEEIKKYLAEVKNKSELERTDLNKDKTGVFSGYFVTNPISKKQIPVWIADYVTMSYGTGAIMSVPSHDARDGEFAKKFQLEVDEEFVPDDTMMERIEALGVGERSVTYHLRDWIFSRQHYWGEPIPMIKCNECGWVPVPDDQLPVVLPEVEKYQPTDTGESPLANISEWVNVKCPKCGGEARRETDTMPNWAGSDWYFLRYCDPKNEDKLADMEKMKYWLPVDVYVGGDEHNTLHLLYSRFIYQFLWDLGVVPKEYPEPYRKRLSHGVLLGPDGNRMSKSKGNVIVPDVVADAYGADVLRTYMMFMGPFDATMAWNERSLVGVKRFVEKVYKFVSENAGRSAVSDERTLHLVAKLIKSAGDDLGEFKFNTVIAHLMETTNELTKEKLLISNEDLGKIVRIMAPFAPFVAEELWSLLGGEFSVHNQEWPVCEEKYLQTKTITVSVQMNGKFRGNIEVSAEADEVEVIETAKKDSKILGYLNSGVLLKTIYVKGRTVNFVMR